MTEATAGWRDVLTALRADIASGRYPPGEQLPTQAALSSSLRASRHAVRRAVTALEREGVIQSWQGKGTFVRTGRVDYAIGPKTRFSTNLVDRGLVPRSRLVATRRRPAPQHIAALLGLSPREKVIEVEILRFADGAPLMLARHHVDAARFPHMADDFCDTLSITHALRRAGIESFTRAFTTIEARAGTHHETALLDIAPVQPVLVSCGQNVDAERRPVEVSVAVSRADRMTFAIGTAPAPPTLESSA